MKLIPVQNPNRKIEPQKSYIYPKAGNGYGEISVLLVFSMGLISCMVAFTACKSANGSVTTSLVGSPPRNGLNNPNVYSFALQAWPSNDLLYTPSKWGITVAKQKDCHISSMVIENSDYTNPNNKCQTIKVQGKVYYKVVKK